MTPFRCLRAKLILRHDDSNAPLSLHGCTLALISEGCLSKTTQSPSSRCFSMYISISIPMAGRDDSKVVCECLTSLSWLLALLHSTLSLDRQSNPICIRRMEEREQRCKMVPHRSARQQKAQTVASSLPFDSTLIHRIQHKNVLSTAGAKRLTRNRYGRTH